MFIKFLGWRNSKFHRRNS